MKICVLEDGYEDSSSPLKSVDPPADPAFYLPDHTCDRQALTKANATRRILDLSTRGYDLFLNLCDGSWDEDRPGIEVVHALERLGLPFTGADSAFYDPSRESMKMVCRYNGVGTPDGFICRTDEDLAVAARTLRFPLIAKHPNSYSSIGLTRESRVTSGTELLRMGSRMIREFGSTLVEEFIDGREFTVLVAENADDPLAPIVYRPVEFTFPKGETFKHFDLKWKDYEAMGCSPCSDPELEGKLKEAAARLFVGLRGTGYGRCDIRVNGAGEIFVLEINPNCGVFYPPSLEGSADYILTMDKAGHAGFAEAIFRAAFKRREERLRSWSVRYSPTRGYGLYATREVREGELVIGFENTPHVLVSRSFAERTLRGPGEQEWFDRYAYPLTDEFYVTWESDPEKWKPMNHSCDPNTWLCGLDVHARKPIAAGEELTIDYATFCNETMSSFPCRCGSANCRGIIRGTDYLADFVSVYGDHVSDYVRTKRKSHQKERT